jgi:hypothetical protein
MAVFFGRLECFLDFSVGRSSSSTITGGDFAVDVECSRRRLGLADRLPRCLLRLRWVLEGREGVCSCRTLEVGASVTGTGVGMTVIFEAEVLDGLGGRFVFGTVAFGCVLVGDTNSVGRWPDGERFLGEDEVRSGLVFCFRELNLGTYSVGRGVAGREFFGLCEVEVPDVDRERSEGDEGGVLVSPPRRPGRKTGRG